MSMDKEQRLMVEAINAYEQRSYETAQASFLEIIDINSNNVDAYFHLGSISHIQGKLGAATKYLKKVLELDPKHIEASVSLSVILNDIGKYDEAQKVFDQANSNVKSDNGIADISLDKTFSSKHYELAEMYMSYNRFDEALFEYNKASSLNPDGLEIRIKIAKVFSKKGMISKAIEELNILKNEYPRYTPARLALGLLHYGKGDIVSAQTQWQQGLTIDPCHKQLRMYLDLSHSATESTI